MKARDRIVVASLSLTVLGAVFAFAPAGAWPSALGGSPNGIDPPRLLRRGEDVIVSAFRRGLLRELRTACSPA